MKLQFILLAGVATAAISFVPFTTAMAGSYDDQVEETRALNLQALAAARGENDMPMWQADVADDQNGQGGPSYDGPPDPDDLGDEPLDDEDMEGPEADEAVDAEDAPDDEDGDLE